MVGCKGFQEGVLSHDSTGYTLHVTGGHDFVAFSPACTLPFFNKSPLKIGQKSQKGNLEPQGQPFINGCFNWMIPNLYIGNGCFTKHLFINGCLGFQEEINIPTIHFPVAFGVQFQGTGYRIPLGGNHQLDTDCGSENVGRKKTPKIGVCLRSTPPPRMPVTYEGFGWDSLLKME